MSKIFKLLPLIIAITLICVSCSDESSTSQQLRPMPKDRATGFQAPDGTYVGPRGEFEKDGTPKNIGSYGKRKAHKGDLVIDKDGSKISNIDVSGAILVNANSVTISNFTATRVTQQPGKKGMVLEDGDIDGQSKNQDGIQWNNFTVRRVQITGSFDGIKAQGNVVIEDSYIHDLYSFKGKDAGVGGYTHNDCIQVSLGNNITIQRNWLVNCGLNSAVFIDPDQGKIDSVTVKHNYLDGGGITLYAIASRSANNGIPTNVNIENNVFGDSFLFDRATVAKGINFSNNVTKRGEPIVPKLDEDET